MFGMHRKPVEIHQASQTNSQGDILKAINKAMAIIEFNPDGTIITANTNFLTAVGYKLEEIVGKHHRIFCDPKYAASGDYQQFWQTLQQGQFISGQFKRVRHDGDDIWLEASYVPITNNGQLTRIIKFAHDISDRIENAQEQDNKISAINKSTGVIEFSPDGIILGANENFLQVVGYSLEQLRGKHHRVLCGEEYARSPAYQDFWRRLNAGEYQGGQFERRGKNGNVIWLSASYNPMFDSKGKLYKIIKFATDVTQRELNILSDIESVKKAHALSEQTEAVSQQGANVIETAASEMNSVSASAKTSARLISELGDKTSSISFIVSTIKDIADQTNLLALNAAIEAARAGEQGRGFAVVADEVRKLAERTSASTREIAAMIENISVGTQSAISGVNAMLAQAERGVECANNAGVAINGIRESSKQVVRVINTLSAVEKIQQQRMKRA